MIACQASSVHSSMLAPVPPKPALLISTSTWPSRSSTWPIPDRTLPSSSTSSWSTSASRPSSLSTLARSPLSGLRMRRVHAVAPATERQRGVVAEPAAAPRDDDDAHAHPLVACGVAVCRVDGAARSARQRARTDLASRTRPAGERRPGRGGRPWPSIPNVGASSAARLRRPSAKGRPATARAAPTSADDCVVPLRRRRARNSGDHKGRDRDHAPALDQELRASPPAPQAPRHQGRSTPTTPTPRVVLHETASRAATSAVRWPDGRGARCCRRRATAKVTDLVGPSPEDIQAPRRLLRRQVASRRGDIAAALSRARRSTGARCRRGGRSCRRRGRRRSS